MKHLIIGAGNLGIDLKNEIIRQSGERRGVDLVSFSDGLDVRDVQGLLKRVFADEYDVIWYCVGYGSVIQAKENPDDAFKIYVGAPLAIVGAVRPSTRFVMFSTDYVADENDPANPNARASEFLSEYAHIRAVAEERFLQLDRPNSTVVRIGSLYGTHKPENTLPGRLLKSFAKDTETRIRLPRNLVTPTPTLWLASVLVANLDKLMSEENATIHHCAPTGNVSVWDWGTFVLAGIREPSAFSTDEFYDEERPKISALGSTFLETNWNWHELWKTYFKPEWFMPPDDESTPAPEPQAKPAVAAAKPKSKTSGKKA